MWKCIKTLLNYMLNLKSSKAMKTAFFVEILAHYANSTGALVHLPSPSIFNTQFHIILLHS